MCDLCGPRRAIGIDHELDDARVVAEVDKDQSAVITTARDPPGHRNRVSDAVGADLAAVEITPAVHPVILSTISSSGAVKSLRPC